MPNEIGANDVDFGLLKSLFEDDIEQETPPVKDDTENKGESGTEKPSDEGNEGKTETVDNTKAFAKRLHEKTEQVRNEEREKIAKSMGYETYDEMIKSREKKLLEEKGLDREEVQETVEQLVQQRIENDPRMKELESIRAQRAKEFAERELAELSKITEGEITSLKQLPQDVIDEWTKTGSLKGAYLKLHGEELLAKVKGKQSTGSTEHMNTPSGGSASGSTKRYLTDQEKEVWKTFNPKMTEEELNKIQVDKN